MPFDANKLYCSEVLAILLQNNDGETCLWCRYSARGGSFRPLPPSASLCSRSPSHVRSHARTPLSSSAAFVLCQAVLILFADVSVLDGCKI